MHRIPKPAPALDRGLRRTDSAPLPIPGGAYARRHANAKHGFIHHHFFTCQLPLAVVFQLYATFIPAVLLFDMLTAHVAVTAFRGLQHPRTYCHVRSPYTSVLAPHCALPPAPLPQYGAGRDNNITNNVAVSHTRRHEARPFAAAYAHTTFAFGTTLCREGRHRAWPHTSHVPHYCTRAIKVAVSTKYALPGGRFCRMCTYHHYIPPPRPTHVYAHAALTLSSAMPRCAVHLHCGRDGVCWAAGWSLGRNDAQRAQAQRGTCAASGDLARRLRACKATHAYHAGARVLPTHTST